MAQRRAALTMALPLDTGPLGPGPLGPFPLVFGGGSIGGLYAPVSDDEARQALEAAWETGVRAFDTAPHYGVGLSERRIGDFLAGKPRAEFTVSTKVGRLLVAATGSVDGAEEFYGTPALSRVRDYSRAGVLASYADLHQQIALLRNRYAHTDEPSNVFRLTEHA